MFVTPTCTIVVVVAIRLARGMLLLLKLSLLHYGFLCYEDTSHYYCYRYHHHILANDVDCTTIALGTTIATTTITASNIANIYCTLDKSCFLMSIYHQ